MSNSQDPLAHAADMMRKVYAQVEQAILITKRVSLAMSAKQGWKEPATQASIEATWNEVIEVLLRHRHMEALTVITHIPEGFPEILCDKHDLAEMFYCLCDNAIQAMQGEGKLIIRVSLGFRPPEDPIANITIADTGPGIPEETLKHLFQPFITTKSPETGNGLGLCIVRGLVQKNQGTIQVSSFTGSGTTFTLTFGVAQERKGEKILAPVA